MAGGIRTITYGYDDQGHLSLVSSRNASNSVRNQVGFTYDAWDNVIRDAQAHNGVVDPVVNNAVEPSPSTRYVYDDGSGTGVEARYVRLNKTAYPTSNGTTVGTYVTTYEPSDVGQALVRPSGVADGASNQQITYGYLGVSQIIRSARPQADDGNGPLTLNAGSRADHYAGLDRYGRWSNLKWGDVDDVHLVEHRLYTYDRTGNRLTMDNVDVGGASNYDETYAYDGLNRLVAWEQGRYNGSVIPNANSYRTQTWTLDTMGNWRNATDDLDGDAGSIAATQTAARTVNPANEIITNTATNNGSGVFPTAYDAAGNITSTQRTENRALWIYFAYDGWNHEPASAKDQQTTENNAFDGLGRLIAKGVVDNGTTSGQGEDYYYDGQQIIEVRATTITAGSPSIDTDAREQTLWDNAIYMNAPAIVKLDNNTDGTVDAVLTPTWDANFNVTALVNPSGLAVQRFVYEPYGIQTALNGESNYAATGADEGNDYNYDWSGADYPNFLVGFQGMRYDPDSGTNQTMSRRYLSGLGTWDGRDPHQSRAYASQGMNLLSFEISNPVVWVDPEGTSVLGAIGNALDFISWSAYSSMSAAATNRDVAQKIKEAAIDDSTSIHNNPDYDSLKNKLAREGMDGGVAASTNLITATATVTSLGLGMGGPKPTCSAAASAEAQAAATGARASESQAANAASKAGVLENAGFAQKTYSNAFSEGGAFAGKSVSEVADALRSGKLKPSDVPIDYIVRDGNTLMLNTRSAQALEQAGVPRSEWNAVSRTGDAAYEARLTGQLERNGLTSQGTPIVTPSGGK